MSRYIPGSSMHLMRIKWMLQKKSLNCSSSSKMRSNVFVEAVDEP
jgi:hypothetical protein